MAELDDQRQIDAQMAEIYHAFLRHDVAALDGLFADDFTFSDPAGPVVDKARWLRDIASGELRFESIEVTEPEFRHLGDRVVVLGEATLRARYTKSNYTGRFRYMGVYSKLDDCWKLVLTSAERV